MEPYVEPGYNKNAFNCPHCGAYANQEHTGFTPINAIHQVHITTCVHCGRFAYWEKDIMVAPQVSLAPRPSPDMPDKVLSLYREAASISSKSPRAAAALLRLAIQQLCIDLLGKDGENLNAAIGTLVKDGLPEQVQQALDAIRVIGNNAVHPGQIAVDDAETVNTLFALLNFIVDRMVTQPKMVQAVFANLPQSAKQQIAKRDGAPVTP